MRTRLLGLNGLSAAVARAFRLWTMIAALGATFGPRSSFAQGNGPIVCLVGPAGGASRILEEARVRIRAELRAAGFGVVGGESGSREDASRSECPTDSATITLEVEGQSLTIWSQVSAEHDPLSQNVSLLDRGITAEVIAIRAVDGLRAAVLEALVLNQDVVSRPLAEFASGKPAREGLGQKSPDVAAPEPTAARLDPVVPKIHAGPPKTDGERFRGIVAFGPELVGGAGTVGLSLGASVDFWWKFLGLGLTADAALLGPTWETQGTKVAIREYGLGVRAQLAPCPKPVLCQFGAGLSIRTVGLDAVQSLAGSEFLERGAHTSPAADFGVGVGYWLGGSVGIMASGWFHFYMNAARLVIGAEESVWGRPSYAVTVGPFFRL